ncbi:leucine--tRNA ligase [Candidatus Woesebacteria bacterium]|nr:leucine--tRNA ligase [Candidatus Woesebacteria bacterium]
MQKYLPNTFEEQWIEDWKKKGLFQSAFEQKDVTSDNKEYLLFAFAYPSGSGLHVGHVEAKTALDILARYYRMQGKKVFFPVGWDAFGLPAENFAIKSGVHPAETTKKAINTFRKQINRLGISYDWESEIATSHPEYYKWTQWLFLQLYKKGLAYKKKAPVNWCLSCQTVLANEQVVNGLCERCDNEVVQKEMDQWVFKITEYAEELIEGLNQVDWPVATKHQQLNWIGKKFGIDIHYEIPELKDEVTCFTTRPDTNFGATFIVLAPEHRLVEKILQHVDDKKKQEIEKYVETAKNKKDIERTEEGRKKTGVFTGFYIDHKLTGKQLPIYISDFVLAHVGTGAVVGVPGHDLRDFEFAQTFNIEVVQVVKSENISMWRSYLMGADDISNKDLESIGVIIAEQKENNVRLLEIPKKSIEEYKKLIRKKLSSGYWNELVGEEIWFCFKDTKENISEYVYSEGNKKEIGKLCAEYNNDPLEKTQNLYLYLASNDWYINLMIQEENGAMINSTFLNGQDIHQATKSMMDYLEEKGWGKRKVHYKLRDWLISRQRYWGAPIPIVYDPDGKPHVVKEEYLPWLLPTDVDFLPTGESPLRLSKEFKERVETLYGKGWTPEYDTMDTFVDSSWYFFRYTSPRDEKHFANPEGVKTWMPPNLYMIGPEHIVLHLLYSRFLTKFLRDEGYTKLDEPFPKMRHQGIIMGPDGKRMSKSRGNIINPDTVIAEYGADTLRLYEMFMGPIEADKPWNESNIQGPYRFLSRIWHLFHSLPKDQTAKISAKLASSLNKTIQKVTQDIVGLKYNTAIAAMMSLLNDMEKYNEELDLASAKKFLKLLAPFAPFITEEIWRKVLGEKESIHVQSWPQVDDIHVVQKTFTIPVQVDGKVRSTIQITSKEERVVVEQALSNERIKTYLSGKKYKTIYIPGKILNFVLQS